MTEEKGLDEAAADKIGEYVKLAGKAELVEKLLADPALAANASAKQGRPCCFGVLRARPAHVCGHLGRLM